MKTLFVSIALLLFTFQKTLSITDGQLDPHFGNQGIVMSSFGTPVERSQAVIPQPDGSLVATGCVNCSAQSLFVVAQYLANGTLDTSFNQQGWITGAILPINGKSNAKAIGLQDTRIIVAGDFVDRSGLREFLFIRLNRDGTLDKTFPLHSGEGYIIIPRADPVSLAGCIIQPDRKILVAGFLSGRERSGVSIIRLEPDGVFDTSFNNSGILDIYPTDFKITSIQDIALQADGSINVIGSAEITTRKFFIVIRCTKDGKLDTITPLSSNPEMLLGQFGGSANDGYAIEVQEDGKILVGGGSNYIPSVGRINRSDNFDPSFYVPGQSPFPGVVTTQFNGLPMYVVIDLLVQHDGKILALCESPSSMGIVRYWPNGTIDTSFNPQGTQPGTVSYNGFARKASLQRDGNLVIALEYIKAKAQFALARYIANSTAIL